jgi:hypothetical protein
MDTTFKPSDDVLKELVAARREEVVRLQKSQTDQIKDLETRGRARIEALNKTLPKEVVAGLESLTKTHDEASAATKAHVDKVKAKLAASRPSPENETAVHPGLSRGHLVTRRTA